MQKNDPACDPDEQPRQRPEARISRCGRTVYPSKRPGQPDRVNRYAKGHQEPGDEELCDHPGCALSGFAATHRMKIWYPSASKVAPTNIPRMPWVARPPNAPSRITTMGASTPRPSSSGF